MYYSLITIILMSLIDEISLVNGAPSNTTVCQVKINYLCLDTVVFKARSLMGHVFFELESEVLNFVVGGKPEKPVKSPYTKG